MNCFPLILPPFNFAKTLRGLLMVTIEKVWNAIVGVIWKAIETATGIALPIPDIN
jgi:hypothetical protein